MNDAAHSDPGAAREGGSVFPSDLGLSAVLQAMQQGRTSAEQTAPRVPGYEVLDEIGRGGMGIVFRARQIKHQRIVALKLLLAGTFATAEELQRFRLEGRVIAGLRHPNIVQIFDIGEHEGIAYLAIEFVEGGSLRDRLAGRPFDSHAAARLVEQLARALAAVHSQGIIHRDLKPANILLAVGGANAGDVAGWVPKIADFGLARDLDAGSIFTATGVVMGTPEYMAPEQAEGRRGDIGPATDIHGLGAVFYELLTGRPPFRGRTPLETAAQVRAQTPAPPTSWNRNVPAALEAICLKCLEKAPADRPGAAIELADDLGAFLDRLGS